jgi:mannose-1-phosphate guanylyltransferase/phosphomannomutase
MGSQIRGEMLTALMTHMMLTDHPRGTVVVPVHATGAVEQIARRHDGQVIRTKAQPHRSDGSLPGQPQRGVGGQRRYGLYFPQNCTPALTPCSASPS